MNPEYTRHQPKSYRPKVPIFWWLKQWAYFKFVARELTSVLVAYSAVMLLVLFWVVDQGQVSEFMGWLSQPSVVVFHVAVFLGLLFHSVTWLNIAPMAIVPKVGGRIVPAKAVLLGHYAAWFICSVVVAWVLTGK